MHFTLPGKQIYQNAEPGDELKIPSFEQFTSHYEIVRVWRYQDGDDESAVIICFQLKYEELMRYKLQQPSEKTLQHILEC